ncbi:hypothetical protein A9Q99_10270 [Gammaproteobacteria bacterium 45_16_T64]|nr:hypothetical protein A9Q99_10270 [Gammaproteobacteria bacterium 45_16_T64]
MPLTAKAGITIDLLNLAAKNLNLTIIYHRYPWSRCLRLLEDSKIDGVFHASYNPDREKIAAYPIRNGKLNDSLRIHRKSYSLYTRKGSNIQWDGQSFDKVSGEIGAVFKYAVVDELRGKGVKVSESWERDILLKKLIGGHLSGVVDLENLFEPLVSRLKDEAVVRHPIPISTKNYYLIYSREFFKNNGNASRALWDQLKTIRESAEYSDIVERYVD